MATDIHDFAGLEDYCSDCPEQAELLVKIVNRLAGPDRKADSEEGFVRTLYHLDPEMKVPAEVLRFVAVYLYPFYVRGELAPLAEKLGRAGENREGGGALICEAMQEMGPGRTFADTVPVMEISDASSEAVNEEMDILHESLEIVLEEDEGEEIISAVAEVVPEAEKPSLAAKIHIYLKGRKYFFPEMKAAAQWTAKRTALFYRWLEARKFFWPQVHSACEWCAAKVANAVRWVKDEQEYFVWLRSYQGKSAGYHLILRKRTPRVALGRCHRPCVQKICECEPKDALAVIKGVLTLSKLDKEEREPLTHLKDYIVMKEKLLGQPETTFDAINYGRVKFWRVLKRAGRLSNTPKLNARINAYFLTLMAKQIEEASAAFRKGLEGCSMYFELKKFLARYPLYRLTMVKEYPNLSIILAVKKIVRDFEERPLDLVAILNQHLGACGEANVRKHLTEVLLHSQINEDLWEVIGEERYLDGVVRRLKKVPRTASCRSVAGSIAKMIGTFMSGEGKFTFSEFKTGLNFVPERVQRKITRMVRQKLQEDLNIEVNTILMQRGKYVKRMKKLSAILSDPRFQGASLTVFGYPPFALGEKIASMPADYPKPRHIFADPQVPDALIELVIKAKKTQEASEAKTVSNCLEMLQKIEGALSRRERVNLHRVLVALFKVHGDVNFAVPSAQLSGYRIAHQIDKFYHTPDRTALALGEETIPEVKEIVQNMVDGERKRQLQKMEKSKDPEQICN